MFYHGVNVTLDYNTVVYSMIYVKHHEEICRNADYHTYVKNFFAYGIKYISFFHSHSTSADIITFRAQKIIAEFLAIILRFID